MAYNYGYPYMDGGQYGNGSNYQPMPNMSLQNQQALNPYYQAQMMPVINNQRFNAFFVNDYSEVKNANVSSDGKPSLFMMNDRDIFYIKKIGEDGRTTVKAFQFQEYIDGQSGDIKDKEKSNELNRINDEIEEIKRTLSMLAITFQDFESKNKGEIKNEQSESKFTANDF